MSYSVQLSDQARKALKKLDRYQSSIIISWINKNLEGCDNPRLHGKPLSYDKSGYWRYRIGAYRLIASIFDDLVIIEIVNVGHRRDVYDGVL